MDKYSLVSCLVLLCTGLLLLPLLGSVDGWEFGLGLENGVRGTSAFKSVGFRDVFNTD